MPIRLGSRFASADDFFSTSRFESLGGSTPARAPVVTVPSPQPASTSSPGNFFSGLNNVIQSGINGYTGLLSIRNEIDLARINAELAGASQEALRNQALRELDRNPQVLQIDRNRGVVGAGGQSVFGIPVPQAAQNFVRDLSENRDFLNANAALAVAGLFGAWMLIRGRR